MSDDAGESRIRRMERADIPAGLRLCAQAGWNQTGADWLRLLHAEPDGCFVLGGADGAIRATVTTTVYGATLAWIGMMLVDTAYRRRGYARALLRHALDYLEQTRGIHTIALDATSLGMPLYNSLGFIAQYSLTRYEGRPAITELPADVRELRANDLSQIAALDAEAFGADRLPLLQRFLHEDAVCGYGLPGASESDVRGYVLTRPGARTRYIGPLVATDGDAAELLLQAAIARHPDEPIAIDIPDEIILARYLAERFGLEPVRSFTRMSRGDPLPPATRDFCFAIAGPEIG
jgi:GNAT superfamily N-acetyltransferase